MHLMQLTARKKDDFNIARFLKLIQLVREQKYKTEQSHYSLGHLQLTFNFSLQDRFCYFFKKK